jgi:hypothetical protein
MFLVLAEVLLLRGIFVMKFQKKNHTETKLKTTLMINIRYPQEEEL